VRSLYSGKGAKLALSHSLFMATVKYKPVMIITCWEKGEKILQTVPFF
jgi:hypothetical protein